MERILDWLIKLIKKIFWWIKYIIIIIFCFICHFFSKNTKLENEKNKMKEKKLQSKKKEPISSTSFKDNPTLIKNSIFGPTKETLKEKIIEFYCEKYQIKRYELTKEDEQIIEKIEEEIIPQLAKEIETKHIQNEEELKEKIKELSLEELNKIELEIKKATNIEDTPKKTTEKNIFSSLPMKQKVLLVKNTPLKSIFHQDTLSNQNNRTPFITDQKNTPIITPKKEKNIQASESLNNTKAPDKNLVPLESPLKRKETLQSSPLEIQSVPLPEIELENIEFLEDIPPNLDNQKVILEETIENQKSKEEPKEELKKKKKQEEQKPILVDTSLLDDKIKKISENKNIELTKEEFEDKDYDKLIIEIDILLKEITNLKQKPLTEESKQKLIQQESKLNQVKKELEIKKGEDLKKEENLLQEAILDQELFRLEEELKKLHLENQIDLNEKNIQKAEDLEFLSKEQVSKIEKELIKLKIKKACKTLELPSILLLPFIRNKYFFYFTAGLFVSNHLNFLNLILRHKTSNFTKPELEEIRRGNDALNESLNLTNNNIAYLSYLENDIRTKYPELSYDEEYLIYINRLKYNLIKNQEKLLKKKKMIEKYNLKYQVKVRKLKKKKIA